MKNKIASRKRSFFYDLPGNQISPSIVRKDFFNLILNRRFIRSMTSNENMDILQHKRIINFNGKFGMLTTKQFNISLYSALAIAVLASTAQTASAHTRLETATVNENTRITNNVIIGHGCGENNVIGTSVVFPDGVDSVITVDGQPHTGGLTDFLENWGGQIQQNYSRAIFSFQDEKTDSKSNVVGFWAGGGNSLPHHLNGYIPFRIGAVVFKSASCAKSVKFYISIADICEITDTAGFNNDTVNLWTHNALGTAYDRKSTTDDGPASLTVTRTSALQASCGTGVAVEVKPSATQINRDMPIKIDGTQVWPK
jgi:hypothetical protein